MAGRKPKPTYLKILANNPGKRALNDAEPIPVGDLGGPPEHFSGSQKEIWEEAISIAAPGLLKKADGYILEVLVGAVDIGRECLRTLNSAPTVYKDANGVVRVNPLLAEFRKQSLIVIKAGGSLGFAPAERSRMIVPQGDDANKNPFANLSNVANKKE